MSETTPADALTQPSPPPAEANPLGVQPQSIMGAASGPPQPVATGALPGMTPGSFEAATQPMGVQPGVMANPWTDPNAIQHMLLAQQGLQDFDAFTRRNNIARMVPGKRIKSFVRVPNGLMGMTMGSPITPFSRPSSDVYIPVMEDEDDKAAYQRFLNDKAKWDTDMVPYRMANYFADRLLPKTAETLMSNPLSPTADIPLALDSIRQHIADNSPIYGLEYLDSQTYGLMPDWTWAVFGGAMKGGQMAMTAGMLRFAETGAGQSFMRGIQSAGLGKLQAEGLPFGEGAGAGLLGPPAGRSTPLFEWLGQRVGVRAFSNVRPSTLAEAESALKESGAKLRITPQGLDIGLTGEGAVNQQRLVNAMRALKAEMSAAGEKAAFRIFTDIPSTFGTAAGGGVGSAAIEADRLSDPNLTAEERKAIMASIPGAATFGAALPLGFRAIGAGIDALTRSPMEGRPAPIPVGGVASAEARAALARIPARVEPPGPPRILGEGPGPIGAPPSMPGPFGPSSPDSGLFSVPLADIPVPTTEPGTQSPSPEAFSVQQSSGLLQDLLPSVQDPKHLFAVRQFMQQFAAQQQQMTAMIEAMGADPSVLDGRNKAVAARLATITKLIGKDLAPTSMALGLPAEQLLFDPNLPPEVNSIEPVRMGLFQWAQALGEEAQRAGLDLPTETAALPAPAMPWDLMSMTARLQGLAQIIHQRNPSAAVGPPTDAAVDIPDEVRRMAPAQVDPIRLTKIKQGMPEATDFPTAQELREDPVAVRKQALYAARAAHNLRFHIGDLAPNDFKNLRDFDPIRVPVYQDAAGRLMASIPSPDNTGLADVEVTDNLTRAFLPEGADWNFVGNPLSPVPYKLDREQGLLSVDQEKFPEREWARDLYKQGLWNHVQGDVSELASPFNNPVRMAQALAYAPPTTLESADALLDHIDKAASQHAASRPTVRTAAEWAGPGASIGTIANTYGDMLREYAGMGMLIEHTRAAALDARAQLEANLVPREPFEQGPPSPYGEGPALFAERQKIGPGFFSKLIEAIETAKADRWQPDQLVNFLKGRGVKNVEILATGLEDALKELMAGQRKGVSKTDLIEKLNEPQTEISTNAEWATYTMPGPKDAYNSVLVHWNGNLLPAPAVEEKPEEFEPFDNFSHEVNGIKNLPFNTISTRSEDEHQIYQEFWVRPYKDVNEERHIRVTYNKTGDFYTIEMFAPKPKKAPETVDSGDSHFSGKRQVVGFFRHTLRDDSKLFLLEEYQRGQWLTRIEEQGARNITPFQDTWKSFLLRNALLRAVSLGATHFAWTPSRVQKDRWSGAVSENVKKIMWAAPEAEEQGHRWEHEWEKFSRRLDTDEVNRAASATNTDPMKAAAILAMNKYEPDLRYLRPPSEMPRSLEISYQRPGTEREGGGGVTQRYKTLPLSDLNNHVGQEYTRRIIEALKKGEKTGEINVDAEDFKMGLRWTEELYDKYIPNELQRLARANGWGDLPLTTVTVKTGTPPRPITQGSARDYERASRAIQHSREYRDEDPAFQQMMAERIPGVFDEVVEDQERQQAEERERLEEDYSVDETPVTMPGYYVALGHNYEHIDPRRVLEHLGLDESLIDNTSEGTDGKLYFHDESDADEFLSQMESALQTGDMFPELRDKVMRVTEEDDAIDTGEVQWVLNGPNGEIERYDRESRAYDDLHELIYEHMAEGPPPDDYDELLSHWTHAGPFESMIEDIRSTIEDMSDEDLDQYRSDWSHGRMHNEPEPETKPEYKGPTDELPAIEITDKMREQLMDRGLALFLGRKGDEDIQLEREVQTIMRMAREGDRAQTRFDPRLIGALGANQYGASISRVIVKELLQNAKDSLMAEIETGWRRNAEAKLAVSIEPRGKTIHVSDNGIGMTPEVASQEFVEIGGSFKPAASSSGGFGMAKVAFLPNAKQIQVVTIAETPDGRIKTILKGSGEDWADPNVGLKMNVSVADATEEPGTSVLLKMQPDININLWEVQDFLRNFIQGSELPFKLDAKIDGQPFDPGPLSKTPLTTLHTQGANIDLSSMSEEIGPGATVSVANNGIFQFTITVYTSSPNQRIPRKIWANVRPTVGVDDPEYPFTTNRENLKQAANKAIEDAADRVGQLNARRQVGETKMLVTNAPKLVGDSQSVLLDTMQNLPDALTQEIVQHPGMGKLAGRMREIHDLLLAKLQSGHLNKAVYNEKPSRWLGYGVSGSYYGVNFNGPALEIGQNRIAVNPFAIWKDVQKLQLLVPGLSQAALDQMFAGMVVATIAHEITHQEVPSDTAASFGVALTKNLGILADDIAAEKEGLADFLRSENGLRAKLDGLTDRIVPLWGTGKDVFDTFAAHASRRPPGGINAGGPPGSGGRGAGQPDALRSSAGSAPAGDGDSTDVRGGGTGEAQRIAELRARALAVASSGGGWSGAGGAELFGALTDDERFDALMGRLLSGNVVNRKHLMNLSPQQWEATGKYPSYFKAWRPTPAQMGALKDAWTNRLDWFNRSEQTLGQLRTAAAARKAGERPDWINLESINAIDPAHLNEMYDNPDTLDEWVNNFWRVIEPLTNEAQATPEDAKREGMLKQLDLLKDAVRTMTGDRILAGVHPYDDPPTAYGAMKRLQAWAHNSQAIPSGAIRRIGRPSYVIGWRKQLLHPKEFEANKPLLARNVFHLLDSAYLNQQVELEKTISATDELHMAASQWMRRRKPLEAPEVALNLNAAPPTDIPKDVLLDRSIYTFLRHRTPVSEIEKSPYRHHSIPVGALGRVAPTKIDLAEWMPKLYQIYDKLIADAEQSELLKTRAESVRYKAKGEALEAEMQMRILAEAQRLLPDKNFKAFENIHADVVNRIMTGLRETDEGNPQADPNSLGSRPFRSIKAGWEASLRQYKARNEHIKYIQSGGLRREGYVTAVHKIALPTVRDMLRDSNSVFARYTSPDVKNYYLNNRLSDAEPYHSWAVSWLLYLPAMLKTIHMQPAFVNVAPKIQQLPADLRNYADQMIRRLKGQQTPFDELMNRLGFQSLVESPTIASELSKLGGGDFIKQLREDSETRKNLVGSKPWTRFVEGFAGATYLALMSPIKVAALNVTELGFLTHEYMKRPIDMVPGLGIIPYALARSGFEGIREFASWLHQLSFGGPRWYSEATQMRVTDALNELLIERHSHPHPFRFAQNAQEAMVGTWYAAMRVTQQPVNAAAYYAMKANAKIYGLDEDEARYFAARITKDLAGLYGPMDTPPNPRGSTGRAVFQFKRFLAAKTDLLLGDVTNATRLFMTPNEMNTALGHGGGMPPPPTPPGMAPSPAAAGGGVPPTQPPQRLRNSSFGDWDPDEREAWEQYSEPVAPFGATFPSPKIAQWRSFLALLGLIAAVYPGFGTVMFLSRLMWGEHDDNAPGQNLWDLAFPWDFRRFNSIPGLWPIEYIGRIGMLEMKKWAPFTGGLSTREERELEQRERTMVEATYFVGQFLKAQRFQQQQDAYEQKKQKAIDRQMNAPAPRPHRPSRHEPKP